MVYAKIKLKLKTAPAPFNLITVNAPERLIFPVQKILFKCYKTVQVNKPFKIGNAYYFQSFSLCKQIPVIRQV